MIFSFTTLTSFFFSIVLNSNNNVHATKNIIESTSFNLENTVILKTEKLFRSNARQRFQSDRHFIEYTRLYHDKFRNADDTINNQPHPVILILHNTCASDCHKALKAVFDKPHQYSIINNHHALVTISPHQLNAILPSHKHIISSYTHLLPEEKVEESVYNICTASAASDDTTIHTYDKIKKPISTASQQQQQQQQGQVSSSSSPSSTVTLRVMFASISTMTELNRVKILLKKFQIKKNMSSKINNDSKQQQQSQQLEQQKEEMNNEFNNNSNNNNDNMIRNFEYNEEDIVLNQPFSILLSLHTTATTAATTGSGTTTATVTPSDIHYNIHKNNFNIHGYGNNDNINDDNKKFNNKLKTNNIHALFTHHTDCQSRVVNTVNLFSKLPQVIWIERQHEIHTFNRWSKGVCQTGDAQNFNLYSAPGGKLNGDGEIVGVIDTGLDLTSCYLHDASHSTPYNTLNLNHRKVVSYMYTSSTDKFDDDEGHGTHVTGSVLGFSLNDYGDPQKFDGMAYNARVAFFDIGKTGISNLYTPSNLNTGLFKVLYDQGARIMSNSWGSDSDHSYSSQAVEVDQFMYSNPDAIVFFANGNGGSNDAFDLLYTTVGSPATCKNCVSVGASFNDHESWRAFGGKDTQFNYRQMADFSSKGPTLDGRLKPDVVAPGWWTSSPGSGSVVCNATSKECPVPLDGDYHCTLKFLRGTSMATPTVAGMAVLVRQYFTQGYYPSGSSVASHEFTPSGALIKAMLIHSASAMENVISVAATSTIAKTTVSKKTLLAHYPSNEQGYGIIQIDKVLNFAAKTKSPINLFIMGSSNNNTSPDSDYYAEIKNVGGVASSDKYNFTSSATQDSVRVTLVWTDYVGTAGSSQPMVNHLTLTVSYVDKNGVTQTLVPYTWTGTTTEDAAFSDTGPVKVIDIVAPQKSTIHIVTVTASQPLTVSPQSYAVVITGVVTKLNTTVSYTNSAATVGDVKVSTATKNILIILTITAVVLTCIMASIYQNQRIIKKAFYIEAQRRASRSPTPVAGRSRAGSVSSVGTTQSRTRARSRSAGAPGSRRPSTTGAGGGSQSRPTSGAYPAQSHSQSRLSQSRSNNGNGSRPGSPTQSRSRNNSVSSVPSV